MISIEFYWRVGEHWYWNAIWFTGELSSTRSTFMVQLHCFLWQLCLLYVCVSLQNVNSASLWFGFSSFEAICIDIAWYPNQFSHCITMPFLLILLLVSVIGFTIAQHSILLGFVPHLFSLASSSGVYMLLILQLGIWFFLWYVNIVKLSFGQSKMWNWS